MSGRQDTEQPAAGEPRTSRFTFGTLLLLLVPVVLLVGVIGLFLSTGAVPNLQSAAPVESLDIERVVLQRGRMDLYVRNTGPGPITIAQAIVNDAVMHFEAQPDASLPRLGRARIQIGYTWSTGEAYRVTLFTGSAIAFGVEIPVAFETPQPSSGTFWAFTLIGLYVGVIPVFLGIFWFPALRRLGRSAMTYLMAATAGLLVFLGLDTLSEALETAGRLPSPFQGIGLIGIGAVGTFLLLDALSHRQTRGAGGDPGKRLAVALTMSIGIGFHNLGEGLAIGAAYNLGQISLGTFLVVGFIIQNITEGLGIIAPVLHARPGIRRLALMGLIGGGPAILGAWIGGFSAASFFAVLFLAIGTGAIFEVVYEIARLLRQDGSHQAAPLTVFSGALTGMLLLWLTGLWIK